MIYQNFSNTKIYNENVLNLYDIWEEPTVIISDGAYGVNGFPTDPNSTSKLKNWYEEHIKKWSKHATPETTLWFWNTEIGWATVHPLLEEYGWEYRGLNIWNKGIQHIAGNTNTQTLRKFPQVTEVCAHYVRSPKTILKNTNENIQSWMRNEWDKTGLTLDDANTACDVSSAASRKYLTKDDNWYFPPPDKFKKLIDYANKNGKKENKPYFQINGEIPTEDDLKKLRGKFDCPVGVTNVWNEPPIHTNERIKNKHGKYVHLNQKPKKLMKRIIKVSSDKDDIIWEPFGGLCTASLVAYKENRKARCAEIEEEYYQYSIKRFEENKKH